MKKLLSIFLILTLVLSFAACGDGNGDDTDTHDHEHDDTTDAPETENNIIYADAEEILALAKSVEPYAGISCISQTQIYSVYSQNTLLTEMGTYTRDASGNIISQVTDEAGTPVSTEYLIGDEYYTGAVTEGDGVKLALSADEKTSVSEKISAFGADGFMFSLDDFTDIEAIDNEDGTYTLLCSSADEKIIEKLTDAVKNEIDISYAGYESYTVSSVDYQYTINADGKIKGFVVMASIEVTMPEETLAEDETTSIVTFGNYVSFIYAAAVNEYTETLTSESVDLSGVNVTESTYSEHFGG